MTIQLVSLYTNASHAQDNSHRLAVIRWKGKNEKDEATGKITVKAPFSPARCVSIPRVILTVQPECLAKALLAALEDMQDTLLRSLMEDELRKGDKPSFSIDTASVAAPAIAKWAEEQAASSRMSGDKLVAWFESVIAEPLLVKLLLKAGYDNAANVPAELGTKLEKTVEAASKIIASFASPRASYDESTLVNVEKLLAFAPDNDPTRELLATRITKLRQPAVQTLELDL